MSDELKPCPFCGGDVKYNFNIELEPDGIYCLHCHVMLKFPKVISRNCENMGVAMEKMAEVWNRRAEKKINELTNEEIEVVRTHMNAFKENLCNQRLWKEAEEYQAIVDKLCAMTE